QVNIYLCPSRSSRLSNVAPWGSRYGMSDYAGVMLDTSFQGSATQPPVSWESSATFMGIVTKGGHVRTDNPALTQKFGVVRVTGVPDGLSNTIAIMEKAVGSQFYTAQFLDWWEMFGWPMGADWPNMRVAGSNVPLLADNQARLQWQYDLAGNIGRPAE